MNTSLEILCRLCLENKGLPKLLSAKDYAVLAEKAKSCLDIELQVEDLTLLLCHNCEKNLNHFYEFRQRCRSADKEFRARRILPHHTLKQENSNDSSTDGWKLEIKTEISGFDHLTHWHPDEPKISDEASSKKVKHNSFECTFESETELKFLNKRKTDDSLKRKDNTLVNAKTETLRKKQISVQCELCGKIFKNKNILKKHVRSHTGVKLFSCKLCHKRFTRAEHEVVHMRAHRGIRPFVCEICARGFTKRQDLLRHMRIHSEEKNFSCPRCDRKFKRSGDVRSHMRSHTGDKPYSCSFCNKTYSSHSGLKKHERTLCNKITDKLPVLSVSAS